MVAWLCLWFQRILRDPGRAYNPTYYRRLSLACPQWVMANTAVILEKRVPSVNQWPEFPAPGPTCLCTIHLFPGPNHPLHKPATKAPDQESWEVKSWKPEKWNGLSMSSNFSAPLIYPPMASRVQCICVGSEYWTQLYTLSSVPQSPCFYCSFPRLHFNCLMANNLDSLSLPLQISDRMVLTSIKRSC